MLKKRRLSLGVLALTVSMSASAMILPPNDLYKYDFLYKLDSKIDEKKFNEIIDYVINIYKPIIALHGAELVAEKNWNDSTVNAYANQSGKTWKVAMFGGLARRPEITPDGFALVLCHELGHHLGGYFFYKSLPWASSEGQSDYFGAQVCAREVFGKMPALNAYYRRFAPPTVQQKCDAHWKNSQAQRDVCYRTAAAGLSLAMLFKSLSGSADPKFETPDPSVVPTSNERHPQAQCRLDTYFQAALCPIIGDARLIPGKGNPAGTNSKESEAIAMKSSCFQSKGFAESSRPRCWFAPLLNTTLHYPTYPPRPHW